MRHGQDRVGCRPDVNMVGHGTPKAPRIPCSKASQRPQEHCHVDDDPEKVCCCALQGFPLPSAAQVAARLRRFAARLSAEDVLPNSKAYVVAALFPDEASAAAAAAHLKGAADAMFAAAKVPVHAALRVSLRCMM